MIALYADSNGKEIKISGTKDEWQVFAKMLRTDMGEVKCKTVEDPSPYSAAAQKILVHYDNSSKVTIDVNSEGNIFISGSPKVCAEMSDAIQSFASEFQPGEHFHMDYIDSHFIEEQSALVVLYME